MPDEPDEATQTTPQGAEIPVPEREDVMMALRKIATTDHDGHDDQEDTHD